MTEMIVKYVLPVEVAVFEYITKLWICSLSGQIKKPNQKQISIHIQLKIQLCRFGGWDDGVTTATHKGVTGAPKRC